MSQTRVRGIIPTGQKLVLIHRVKSGEDYYVFPGGGVEGQERLEDALRRECFEELGIRIRVGQRLYDLVEGESMQAFFLCSIESGEIGTGKGPEFTQYKGRGKYIPEEVDLGRINAIRLLPVEVRDRFSADLLQTGDINKIPYSQLTRR